MTMRNSFAIGAAALTLAGLAATAAFAASPTQNPADKAGQLVDAQPNTPQPAAANCDCPMMQGEGAGMTAPAVPNGRTHPGGTGSR